MTSEFIVSSVVPTVRAGDEDRVGMLVFRVV